MIEKEDGTYTLAQDASRLIFRTTRFVADRGSVLHSGIYNRELSSVLASFAVAGIAYFLLVMSYGKDAAFYVVFMLLFVGTFPLFRTYVFKERSCEAVFDRTAETVEIRHTGVGSTVVLNRPFASIRGIWIDTKRTAVVNPDGVAFVEKIAAQHGTVIPGFGEEKTFYILKLGFTDGTEQTLFADSSMQDVISVHDDIRGFLKIPHAI